MSSRPADKTSEDGERIVGRSQVSEVEQEEEGIEEWDHGLELISVYSCAVSPANVSGWDSFDSRYTITVNTLNRKHFSSPREQEDARLAWQELQRVSTGSKQHPLQALPITPRRSNRPSPLAPSTSITQTLDSTPSTFHLRPGWQVRLLPPSSLDRKREKWYVNMDEKIIPTYPSSPSPCASEHKQPNTPSSYSTPYSTHDSISRTPVRGPDPGDSSSVVDVQDEQRKVKKDWRFWMIFTALLLIAFCAALDMTMISTALPAIVGSLPPSTIAANWITSAFLLPMVASQPVFGGLASSIGRKRSINTALIIFLVGSVVCACAKSLLLLVVGRGIQGLGGGGIHAMCEIIMSDLTTLRERGLFFGLIALVFAVAGFVAPVLGGAFSQSSWPWIFWINLPIGAVALLLLVLFLNIKVPLLTGKEKWQKLDVFGNTILFGSVTSILIAVTEGGIKYKWNDHRIWVPLVAGLIGMVAFLAVEWIPNRLARKAVFPLDLFQNRTAALSYLQTFMHGIIFYGVIYMVPIYFQAIKDRTPLQSAIWSFPLTAPSFPIAMAAGISLSVTGKYKLLIFIGWALMAGGVGWITHWRVATTKAEWALSQIVAGAGLGILFPITLPPIQASLPAHRLEAATAAYAFTRTFGAVWGITGATTIFSTTAAKNLGPYYPQLNPLGLNDFTLVAYSEHLRDLPEPLQGIVKEIYADAIAKSYWLFLPLAIIGFVTTVGIESLPLPDFIKSEAKMESKQDAIPALEEVGRSAVGGTVGQAEMPSTMP
ncbi:hypothetical protein NDA18_006659 [Ustilago nuda]|nr:hypothetical protein NDA18_006659 [Ustilago nuda]